jgi:hypothetical protein
MLNMGAQDNSIEAFSYRRLVTRSWHQIHTHKLQWFRWWLGLAMKIHSAPIIGKLYWHYSIHHTPSVLPDFLVFLSTMAARFIWLFLFRDPGAFWHFTRPGRAYKTSVLCAVVLTTLPNVILHFWSLRAAFEKETVVFAGIVSAMLAVIMWVPIVGFVWWMAWMFLLDSNESSEDFEPTVQKALTVSVVQGPSLPYTNYAPELSAPSATPDESLSRAYEEQIFRTREAHITQYVVEPTRLPRTDDGIQLAEGSESTEETSSTSSPSASLRCQTTARFEYLSQSHSGPHSWITFPVVPLVLTTFATILVILLPVWIYEDRHYEYRSPSP